MVLAVPEAATNLYNNVLGITFPSLLIQFFINIKKDENTGEVKFNMLEKFIYGKWFCQLICFQKAQGMNKSKHYDLL